MSRVVDGRKILMDLVHYRTYAGVKANGRKETRPQVIDRVKEMHQTKFPWYSREIEEVFEAVHQGRGVPSMRSMQFAGLPIFRSNARIFNCAYAQLSELKDFADLFWLLLNGVGVGYSVQQRHVQDLPIVSAGWHQVFIVEDSKEGWCDGILALLLNPMVLHDTRLVRSKGSVISTGGVASGPESLLEMYEAVRAILRGAVGRQLTSRECFDIMCNIADIIEVGNVRRAATIALFDPWDEEMLTAKHGEWYVDNPQRARANISAVIHREDPNFESLLRTILQRCFDSNCGEPGISLTNDYSHGFNPCHEVSLRNRQMCNLTEINVSACSNLEELLEAVESSTALGTIQASYSDFQYIHADWKKNVEEEALLGVSMTGQAMVWDLLTDDNLDKMAKKAIETNQQWAELLDIKPSARITTTKPSGNTSAWLGTTSGIHAAHSPFILRRVRVDRKDGFGQHLIQTYGENPPNTNSFIETDQFNPEDVVLSIPMNMNKAILRDEESAVELMERAKHVYEHWIRNGHVSGPNTHNVSLTVTYREGEEETIAQWMLDNVDSWAGISLLPHDGGSYVQAPFEALTELEFHQWLQKIPTDIDFSVIDFSEYIDTRQAEIACGGASCEVI